MPHICQKYFFLKNPLLSRAKVDEVLSEIDFREKRARTMDIDDFMKLLHAFNKAGIHFS